MKSKRIHIDNLKLRLPRSLAGDSRDLARRIGREIVQSLADAAQGRQGEHRIHELSAGTIKVSGPGTLEKRVASKVASQAARRWR